MGGGGEGEPGANSYMGLGRTGDHLAWWQASNTMNVSLSFKYIHMPLF